MEKPGWEDDKQLATVFRFIASLANRTASEHELKGEMVQAETLRKFAHDLMDSAINSYKIGREKLEGNPS